MQAQTVLHKLMKNTCPTMHQTRRAALEANILAALMGRRLTVTDLGRSIRSETSHKHNIKRADRLLSNRHLHAELIEIYRGICRQCIGSRTRPVILIDWSDLDERKRHFLLRASLAVAGRALTLYEEVHTLKSKEKPKTHLDFLRTFQTMLPADCRPIIISDAGFRVPWFKQVESFGWDWIGRVRNRTLAQWAAEETWFPCKTLYQQAARRPAFLGAARLARRNPIDCHMILYQAKPKGRVHKNRLGQKALNAYSRKQAAAANEPWLLATSLPPRSHLAKQVVSCYAQRMQIEESFRDLKSTRFGLALELHRTYQVERLQALLLIADLALLVAWLMGKAAELTGQHWQYQANTVRTRKVLSTVFIGLKSIDDNRVALTADNLSMAWMQLHDMIQSHSLYYEREPMRKAA